MGKDIERETYQCDYIWSQPHWEVLYNFIAHWTLYVMVIKTVTCRVMLVIVHTLLIFWFDVRSVALEEVLLNSMKNVVSFSG